MVRPPTTEHDAVYQGYSYFSNGTVDGGQVPDNSNAIDGIGGVLMATSGSSLSNTAYDDGGVMSTSESSVFSNSTDNKQRGVLSTTGKCTSP